MAHMQVIGRRVRKDAPSNQCRGLLHKGKQFFKKCPEPLHGIQEHYMRTDG